jgi:hypothetical protein
MTEKTVILDLDGTLCDINHRLHHIEGDNKNWDAFYADCVHDTPKAPIIELAAMCDDAGHRVIISSGRSEKVRTETEKWLEDQGVVYAELHMRPDNCYVPDNALKKSWLDQGLFGPIEDILFVVEDRDRMVQMWRGAGLICLQVEQWVEEGEQSFPIKKIELARAMAKFISATGQDDRFQQWRKAQV